MDGQVLLDEAGARLEKPNLSKPPPVETQARTSLPWTQPVGVVPGINPAVHLDTQSSESNYASASATCAGPPWFLSLKNETKQANVLPLDLQ